MLAGYVCSMYGERAMADAQKGSALGNLSYAHVAKTPTPSQRSPRPSAGRVAATSVSYTREVGSKKPNYVQAW